MDKSIALERIEELNRSIGFLSCVIELLNNEESKKKVNVFFRSQIDFIYKLYLRDSYQDLLSEENEENERNSFNIAIDHLYSYAKKDISNEREIKSIIEAIDERVDEYKRYIF